MSNLGSRLDRLDDWFSEGACLACGALPGRRYIGSPPFVEVRGDPDSIESRALIEDGSLRRCVKCGASPRLEAVVVVRPALC